MTFQILPGTGSETIRFFSEWWWGSATSASPAEAPFHHASHGSPPRAGWEL